MAEIAAAASALNLQVDTAHYDAGSDFITVAGRFDGRQAQIRYSTVNGRFFGTLDDGTAFCSDACDHEGEEWFDDMLNFFYVPYGATVKVRCPASSAPEAGRA